MFYKFLINVSSRCLVIEGNCQVLTNDTLSLTLSLALSHLTVFVILASVSFSPASAAPLWRTAACDGNLRINIISEYLGNCGANFQYASGKLAASRSRSTSSSSKSCGKKAISALLMHSLMGQLECAPSGKLAACGRESKRRRWGREGGGTLKLICHYAKSLCTEENVCGQKWGQKRKSDTNNVIRYVTARR